jgi:hypothetical protein
MKSIYRFFSVSLTITLAILIIQCESKERFYRPDLPEQICAVGIIDIDDTTFPIMPTLTVTIKY